MVSNRLVLITISLASLASACTAIVLGKVGDTSDYTTVPTIGAKPKADECSLLTGSNGEVDANVCSECIATSCKPEVDYACNRGQQEKKWFDQMRSCAQGPFINPGQGFDDNDCKSYTDAEAPISDNGSDTQKEIEAHNCITNKCLQGATPPCKQCEVSITKSQAESVKVRLQDDPCGSCLATNCQAELVQCCTALPMQSFVQKCAFTPNAENKAACLELGSPVPDAGAAIERDNYRDGSVNVTCRDLISACFKTNCAGKGGCVP